MTRIKNARCWVTASEFWILTCLCCLAQASTSEAQAPQKPETLEQRVARGEPDAVMEAADKGRRDLIPAIEKYADIGSPMEAPRIWTRAALAKLGVKKYLDETVTELTTTNSELFAFYMRNGICPYPSQERRVACATERTQETAFKKLAYIRDPSTVKVVAAFLYSSESFHFAHDVPPWTASGFAILTLRQMVDNPPQTPVEFTREQDIHAWQQWWQQNKDKYP